MRKQNKDDESLKNHLRYEWKQYLLPTGLCILTIVCMSKADILNRRRQAGLISAYTLLKDQFDEFKRKAEEINPGINEEVTTELFKEKPFNFEELPKREEEGDERLFYDIYSKQYFNRTMLEVQDAEYLLNRLFILKGYCTLNDFYELLGLEKTDYGGQVGWSTYAEQTYGYRWIDFENMLIETDDGLECYLLHMPFEPHADYLDC